MNYITSVMYFIAENFKDIYKGDCINILYEEVKKQK